MGPQVDDWMAWAEYDLKMEAMTLATVERHPELAIGSDERYTDVDETRWRQSAYPYRRRNIERVKAQPHVTCDRCEGHGAYNLRRSAMLPRAYVTFDCCRCNNLGVLPS